MAKYTSEDRQLEQDIKKSLSITSYFDQMIDKIETGQDIQPGHVPNFGDGGASAGANESQSLYHLDSDTMYKTAASAIGGQGMSTALSNDAAVESLHAPQPTPQPAVHQASKSQVKISRNQLTAIQKYPALIEFLGSEGGVVLVKEIAAKVNDFMIDKIGQNSKEISKFAQVCKADRQNIKQYFAGKDKEWVCVVTASGPFRGDEAFLYKQESDQAFILRKVNDDYVNVTNEFNMIHEFANRGDSGE